MNILITSASRKVTLIKYFKKALTMVEGGKIIAADINPMSIAFYFADQFEIIPKCDDKYFIPCLLELCKRRNIHLIVPTRDGELKIFAENKVRFEEINCKVMVAEAETIDICLDKFRFYQFCTSNNIPAPKTYLADSVSEVIGNSLFFPVFVKPREGYASQYTFKADNQEKLELFLKLHSEKRFVVQEYVPLEEYTIDLFSDFEGNIISVIPRQRVHIVSGESYIGKTTHNMAMINETIRLAKCLHLIGHNTIQCFFSDCDGKILFMEVNPRYGGGASLGFQAGVCTPEYLIRILKGEPLEPCIGSFKNNLFMFRFTSDSFLYEKADNIFYKDYEDKKVFCIDVDGTICTENCPYEEAMPIHSMIQKVNNLYRNGHKIIFFTSRGIKSGYSWIPMLKQQLSRWGVKYHEVTQGKPYADCYIDNKSLNVLDWI